MSELYERLGVSPDATPVQIKAAYRKAAKEHHPDAGGNADEFARIQLAFDVLSDDSRRRRYDRTGRTDEVKVTPEAIQAVVNQTVLAMINAERPDGSTDNPNWEDIRSKVIATVKNGRRELTANLKRLYKKRARLDELASRFKSRTEADPVGDAFSMHRESLMRETHQLEDALEMNHAMERVFNSYDYEVGPGPEGQYSPGPTLRLSGAPFTARTSAT